MFRSASGAASAAALLARLSLAGAVFGLLAMAADAEEAVMRRAIEAGSLHEGPLDMVAYWQADAAGALVVTATFAERDAPEAQPMRVVMALGEGDAVAFAMPGFPEALYRFSRTGEIVAVSVGEAPLRRDMAGL